MEESQWKVTGRNAPLAIVPELSGVLPAGA